VKDFNSNKKFKINEKFMTNSDVPWIATKDIINAKNPFTGKSIVEPHNKFPFYMYLIKWRLKSQHKYGFNFLKSFKLLKEPIYNVNNWRINNEKQPK